jgi:predicted nuclease of predicted toxin-antitoxin system
MNELNDLSRQNDELIISKDSDLVVIRDLGNQLKEYKRKYEQAKTELRNVKGKNISSDIFPHVKISLPH